jgi:hypothetical protein
MSFLPAGEVAGGSADGGRELARSGRGAARWRHGRRPLLLRCAAVGEGEGADSSTSSRGGGGPAPSSPGAAAGAGIAGAEVHHRSSWAGAVAAACGRGGERE